MGHIGATGQNASFCAHCILNKYTWSSFCSHLGETFTQRKVVEFIKRCSFWSISKRTSFGPILSYSWLDKLNPAKRTRFYTVEGNRSIVSREVLRTNNNIHYMVSSESYIATMINRILLCDWLPKRTRWSYLALSGLTAVSCKKNFPESHIINPLLTKLVRSRGLDIGLILHFF